MVKTNGKTIKSGLQLCLLFFFIQVGLWFLLRKRLPFQVPLYYSRPWGEEQLASSVALLILPIISLIVLIINFVFSSFIPKEEKLANQLLIVFAALFNFLCLITLSKIIFLIT